MTLRSSFPGFACLAALAVAGCGASSKPKAPIAPAASPAPTQTGAAPPRRHPGRGPVRRTTASVHRSITTGLVYSSASNDMVQRQPAAGTCHVIGSGEYERPDPACTPGALNPAVTQATIHSTICVDGWTDTVRPPENITEQEKAASMAAYADAGSMADYEYDHFVPLELGGATNDARNLWPEPGVTPNPKDAVEDELRQEVCDGQVSLARAQHEIASNWTSLSDSSGDSDNWHTAPRYGTL